MTHPQAIDLGLPTGTKWASCNVGATKPEEYGGYYAWGETEEKKIYDWGTYAHYDRSLFTCRYLDNDIAGTKYDVAHVKWGGNWRMPTVEDFQDLFCFCQRKWTTLNGVNGRKFTSRINGNSIFLPAAGLIWSSDIDDVGCEGWYWSSSQRQFKSACAYALNFDSEYADGRNLIGGRYEGWNDYGNRCEGLSVRPVSE